jgi:hypothetical protein
MIVSKALQTLALAIAGALLLSTNSYAQAKKAPFAGGPKTVSSKENVTVLIDREITDGKSYIVLKITVPADSKVNSFTLSDPPRVVVDFEGASVKKSEDLTAPENDVIKQIRIGAHPAKIRFVLDMKRASAPEYDWRAGKRQAVLKFVEGAADTAAAPAPAAAATKPATASPAAALPTQPPASTTAAPSVVTTQAAPTHTHTTIPTAAPTLSPTPQPSSSPTPLPAATKATLSDLEPTAKPEVVAAAGVAAGAAAAAAAVAPKDATGSASTDLGDIEKGPRQPPVATTYKIKGYKFEYLPNKTPVVKILLNKPTAQAQISKVDEETYKVEIKDCGLENEDLELPQFPPHDFLGFVMVISELVGKNTEISISVEEGTVLGTSVHENEIWIKKP